MPKIKFNCMAEEELDIQFVASLYHAYSYALSYALYNVLGPAQATFMHDYAKALTKILRMGKNSFPQLLKGFQAFVNVLNEKGLVEEMYIEEMERNKIKLVIKGCALASDIHSTLGLKDTRDYLCPIAAMAMVAIAVENGYTNGENLFEYIKFSGSLSHLTSDGSITEFLIGPKIAASDKFT